MPLNLFLTFDVESNRPGNYITCEHVPGAPGLFWIMDELERRGARGVFFVNVYEHTRYADGWMQDLLRQIEARGHEVGLHCHANPELDFYRQNLTLYDLEGQTRIIRYGVDFIEAATGSRPVAFRSGALRVNDDTFRALEACQLTIDSSLIHPMADNNNDISAYRSINKAAWYEGVREFPITFVTRYRRDRPPRSARLDPNVTPDAAGLIATVEQMIAAGCHHAILIGHSFSFLLCTYDQSAGLPGVPVFKKDKQKFVMGVDEAAKATFVEFLDFLERRRAAVHISLFRDLPRSDGVPTSGPDFVPRVPDNGLPAWPTVEDYAKHEKAAKVTAQSYRHRPRNVILHAGTWKTGSKALQKFWALNRDELRRRGVFYPLDSSASYMKGGNRSYQSLIATAGDAKRRGRLLVLADEIHGQACETALVSHENICNLALSELLEFVACLAGCRFKVVLYLRRQDHYAASLYNQHVKASVAFPGSFDEHFEQYRSRYDYRQMVERLGTVFGLENVVVRPYEKEAFFGGTIFSDFGHHVLGMASDENFVMPKRDQNSRLDRDALEFKRVVNGLGGAPEKVLSLGKHLIDYCEARDPSIREAFQEHNLLSPAQRARILQECAEGNAWVAREMLGRSDGTLFDEPMPSEEGSWTAYAGLSGEKAVEIAFHVYRSMLTELERRDAEIARLQGGRRSAATPKRRPERDTASLTRTVKRLWKRRWRRGKALVCRTPTATKPKAGYPG